MDYLSRKYRENENFQLLLKILFIMLASRLFMLVLMAIYNVYMGTDRSISFLMNQWDAKRYPFIIDHGYTFPLDTDPQANWAFFPMYVIVCWAVKMLTFGLIDTYWVGMFVSNCCIFIASFVAVKYVRLLISKKNNNNVGMDSSRLEMLTSKICLDDGLLIAILMLWGPYTFYCSSVYTEAMFIMSIALFFLFCAKKRYVLAGIMAALSSATRIVGCLLVFALLIEMYMDMVPNRVSLKGIKVFIIKVIKAPERLFAILLCPLGTFGYMAFLRFFCGDVWAYKNVQIAWREDEYFPILGVLWKACTGQIEPRYTYMGWFCIAMFAIYGYMLYRKYYSMAIFGIISLLIPLTSHVMSTCRFTIGSYVIFFGVYDILRNCNKKVRWGILAFFLAAEIWLLFMWYNSDCWLM
jgi:hypothetical protein